MKKILFSFVTVLMGVLLFSSCANDDLLGVDRYNSYQNKFEKVFGQVNPNQNFNTQKSVTIQSTTGETGNYTLRVYDGMPNKKGTSLIGQFENLSGNSVTPVKIDVSKSLRNIYCVTDNGTSRKMLSAAVPIAGDIVINPSYLNPWEREEYPSLRQSVTIAFEDLGSTDDFDFNDVVITVDYVNGMKRFDVTLQALGGVLPVRLYYQPPVVSRAGNDLIPLFDGKELHEVMGCDTKTMVNTNWKTKDGITGVDGVEPVTETVQEYLMEISEDGCPFIIVVDGKEGQRQITASTEYGATPQAIVIGKGYSLPEDWELRSRVPIDENTPWTPYYWRWPKEKMPINEAYPDIEIWFDNPSDLGFLFTPEEDLLYDGFNPNAGNEEDLVAVDLDLPSGTLWANMNIGASAPEDFGDYYAWGETETKTIYNAESYLYCDGEDLGDNHQNLGDCISGTQYDVATTLGDGWMMPTLTQFNELVNNCTVTYTTLNGVKGWKFTGNNNNSIFLPEAGDFEGTSCGEINGVYWSGTMSDYDSAAMGLVLLTDDGGYTTSEMPRIYGCSVRPVYVIVP